MNSQFLTDLCFLIGTGFFLMALRIILPAFFMNTMAVDQEFTPEFKKGIDKNVSEK